MRLGLATKRVFSTHKNLFPKIERYRILWIWIRIFNLQNTNTEFIYKYLRHSKQIMYENSVSLIKIAGLCGFLSILTVVP